MNYNPFLGNGKLQTTYLESKLYMYDFLRFVFAFAVDPDSAMPCELMDGRDAFLTTAREKHLEFSSLRRCKFSTQTLLYELHTQNQDKFVYTCNSCSKSVETRYHCTVCEDYDLCTACFQREGHPHRMDKFGFDLGGKFGFLFNSFLGMAVWGDLWQLRSDFGRLTGSYQRLV